MFTSKKFTLAIPAAITLFMLTLASSSTFHAKDTSSSSMTLRMELFTTSIQRSVEFYTKVLGFTIEGDQISDSYQPVLKDDIVLGIGLIKNLDSNHYFNPQLKEIPKGYGVEIVLEVDNINQMYEKVVSSGYEIHEPLTKQYWGLTDFRLIDPDGYYLRITSKN
jgi:lactoylglutathione lyase